MLAQGVWYVAELLLEMMEASDEILLEQAPKMSVGVICSVSLSIVPQGYLQSPLRKLCDTSYSFLSVPGQD